MSQFEVGQIMRGLIAENEDLAELVGTRIYPNALPETTSYAKGSSDLPAIWYALVDDVELDEAPISRSDWQFTVVAETQAEVQKIMSLINGLFHRYKSGDIRYIDYVNSTIEWDRETLVAYAPMTYRVTYFKEA